MDLDGKVDLKDAIGLAINLTTKKKNHRNIQSLFLYFIFVHMILFIYLNGIKRHKLQSTLSI